jgi:hypothetical protein
MSRRLRQGCGGPKSHDFALRQMSRSLRKRCRGPKSRDFALRLMSRSLRQACRGPKTHDFALRAMSRNLRQRCREPKSHDFSLRLMSRRLRQMRRNLRRTPRTPRPRCRGPPPRIRAPSHTASSSPSPQRSANPPAPPPLLHRNPVHSRRSPNQILPRFQRGRCRVFEAEGAVGDALSPTANPNPRTRTRPRGDRTLKPERTGSSPPPQARRTGGTPLEDQGKCCFRSGLCQAGLARLRR